VEENENFSVETVTVMTNSVDNASIKNLCVLFITKVIDVNYHLKSIKEYFLIPISYLCIYG